MTIRRYQMKKLYLSLVLALVFVLSIVGVAGAITWGEPDGGEHPHVGTILFENSMLVPPAYWSCSGTLIAPRVFLTAGHCVETLGNTNENTYVRFEEDPVADYYEPIEDWLDDKWLAVETVIPHPNYSDFSEFPYTYDIGVVILVEDYDPSTFGTLPELGFLETLKGKDRQHFVSVGYGLQGTLYPFYQDHYYRYKGTVRLIEIKSALTGGGGASAKFSNNPGVGGGTCYGDSGGPTFYKDTNLVVSVTSFGWAKNGHCVGNDFNYRTDTQDALDFLDDILDTYGD
jgi:hypothetical protein